MVLILTPKMSAMAFSGLFQNLVIWWFFRILVCNFIT